MEIPHLIAALGGPRVVSERLGIRPNAVAMWLQRGAIPAEHYLPLWKMALAANVAWKPPGAEAIRAQLTQQPEAAA